MVVGGGGRTSSCCWERLRVKGGEGLRWSGSLMEGPHCGALSQEVGTERCTVQGKSEALKACGGSVRSLRKRA